MTILMLIGMVFVIIRDVPLEDTFKLCAYTAASDFYEWVQVEIDVYIPHCKYQAKPHSSPSFSGACAAVIVHRNHFFLYQQNTSSESKAKFRKASHCCKTVLEAAKLAYATKTTSLPRNMALMTFVRIANSVLKRGKSAIPPLFNSLDVLPSTSDKAKLFLKNFSKNSNLDDSGSSLTVLPCRINLRLCNISITPAMVKKFIKNLDSSKASGPHCIPVCLNFYL